MNILSKIYDWFCFLSALIGALFIPLFSVVLWLDIPVWEPFWFYAAVCNVVLGLLITYGAIKVFFKGVEE